MVWAANLKDFKDIETMAQEERGKKKNEIREFDG